MVGTTDFRPWLQGPVFEPVSARGCRLRDIKVKDYGLSCRQRRELCSAGVSPAVAGASRSRSWKLPLRPWKDSPIEGQTEARERTGKMPVPQRARRPRYLPVRGFLASRLMYRYARTDVMNEEKPPLPTSMSRTRLPPVR